jgi:hypothetical protein
MDQNPEDSEGEDFVIPAEVTSVASSASSF